MSEPLQGLFVYDVYRAGDKGEAGYTVQAEELPACKKRNHHDYWHGATQDGLIYAMPGASYITQKVYDYLTPAERESVRSIVSGIVPTSYWKSGTCPYYPHSSSPVCSVSKATPMPHPNPCEGVVCKDICIGVSKWSRACATEGADVGTCLIDQRIEVISPDCPGYVPPKPNPTPTPTPPPNPCIGVECANKCEGNNLVGYSCVDGVCIRGAIVSPNAEACMETPKPTPPDPDTGDQEKKTGITAAIMAIIAAYSLLG